MKSPGVIAPSPEQRCSMPGCDQWGSIRAIAPAPSLKDAARGPLQCGRCAQLAAQALVNDVLPVTMPVSAPVTRPAPPLMGRLL
jgi:hypothetical protein